MSDTRHSDGSGDATGDSGADEAEEVSAPAPGGKRARTRARLIAAAAELIGRQGLDATSLEDIAKHAGMTRGAIYGNFKDKDELFLAVAFSRWTPVAPPAALPGEDLGSRMRRYGEAVADAAEARRSEMVGATSFVQYALRNEPLRKLLEDANAGIYATAAARLGERDAQRLPTTVETFVRMVHALTEGCIVLHALSPAQMSRETIVSAFEALVPAGGAQS
jgi:AcrR family transcriptional regulator